MRADGRLIAGLVMGALTLGIWLITRPDGGSKTATWVEFTVAGAVVAMVLTALRWSTAAQSTDQDVGPGGRHETQTTARMDDALRATDDAIQRFVHEGDPAPLVARFDDVGLGARLAPLVARAPDPEVQLIHPAWSYVGFIAATSILLSAVGVAVVQNLDGNPPAITSAALILAGIAGYTRTWNAYGGPWIVRLVWGFGCLAVLATGLVIEPVLRQFFFDTAAPYTLSVLAAMAVLVLTTYPHGKRVRPKWLLPVADEQVVRGLKRQQLRAALRTFAIAAIAFAALLAMAELASLPRGFRTTLDFIIGVLPAVAIAIALPRFIHVLAIVTTGPAAIHRVRTQRQERAGHIIRLLSEVNP